MLLKFLAAVVLTEAVAELFAEATIFERLRVWIESKSIFWGYLTRCGYCLSVWIGLLFSFLLGLRIGLLPLDWLYAETAFLGLIVHRASNLEHMLISFICHRAYPAGNGRKIYGDEDENESRDTETVSTIDAGETTGSL